MKLHLLNATQWRNGCTTRPTYFNRNENICVYIQNGEILLPGAKTARKEASQLVHNLTHLFFDNL